jgi:hypothetical protein
MRRKLLFMVALAALNAALASQSEAEDAWQRCDWHCNSVQQCSETCFFDIRSCGDPCPPMPPNCC